MANNSRSENAATVSAAGALSDHSYVDWPAILAGAVLAAAVSFVLNTFGAGIGLSLISPFGRDGLGGTGILIAVSLWILWVTVSSFMIGGYITGRMRRRNFDASEHESDVRDGSHGLAVWAVGVLLGAILLASGVGTSLKAGGEALSAAASASSGDSAAQLGQRYTLGMLLRPGASPDNSASTNSASTGAGSNMMGSPQATGAEGPARMARADFEAIFRTAADRGEFTPEDKAYMTSVVERRTSLSREEASARVDKITSDYLQRQEEAKQAAEAARKASVVAAFVIAASLLIAAAGSWFAAAMGGRHRDEQTVFGFFRVRR